MATGMAIMGFGGGAMIGSPLATMLMNHYRHADLASACGRPSSPWPHLFRVHDGRRVRLPAAASRLEAAMAGRRRPTRNAMITTGNVHLKDAHKTLQFWLIWAVLCLNVSAGIGIIGAASPMLQETFGGRLFGDPSSASCSSATSRRRKPPLVGAAFVGLFSLFNIAGRFFWASLVRQARAEAHLLHLLHARLPLLCRGPDACHARHARPIRGRLLPHRLDVWRRLRHHPGLSRRHVRHAIRRRHPWAPAHRLVDGRHRRAGDRQLHARHAQSRRRPPDQIYHPIFYVLAGLLVAGFIANLLIRPLDKKWFMSEEEVAALQAKLKSRVEAVTSTLGSGGFDLRALLAWAAVGIPLAWGIWITLRRPWCCSLSGRPALGGEGADMTLRQTVLLVALLNLAYFGVEFAVALTIGSVSLFADSVDFLEDASLNLLIADGLGWTALNRARLGMALAGILLVPVLATLCTAWQKFAAPVPPAPLPLSLTGAGALASTLLAPSCLSGSAIIAAVSLRAAFPLGAQRRARQCGHHRGGLGHRGNAFGVAGPHRWAGIAILNADASRQVLARPARIGRRRGREGCCWA